LRREKLGGENSLHATAAIAVFRMKWRGGWHGMSGAVRGMAEGEAEPLDVIAVGAHPDDVEIACGGTLAHLAALGYRVGIVDLTDGEPTPRSPGPEVRLEEARVAAEILGVAARINLNLPNRRLFDTFESRVALATVFRRYRPSLVIGFGGKTVLASPDHWQAMQLTDAAVFYSRLSKWDEYFDGLSPHVVANQLSFPIALQSLSLPEAAGFVVADISDTLERKLLAIAAYQTQFPPERSRILSVVESMNRHHGHTAGFDAGELFLTYRSIGVGDLLAWAVGSKKRKDGG
jgi:bacillithiol biosynthesis deacetylase BshB1